MKQILIGKNLNYAASKTSTTADTATSPQLLRDGAIAFYTEKGVLIPAAGTGLAAATHVIAAQGTVDGVIVSPVIFKGSGKIIKSTIRDFVAPVKQVSFVGFNGTGGSLNASSPIAKNDEAILKVIETTGGRQVFPKQSYNAPLPAAATAIDIAIAVAGVVGKQKFSGQGEKFVIADVFSNGTLSNFTLTGTTPTMTFTQGSQLVTLGGTTPAFNGVVGEYLKINPSATPTNANAVVYKIIAVNPGVSITLDRAYTGATQTLSQAEAQGTRLVKVASITEAGIRLTAENFGVHFRLASSGVIEDADISYVTPFNPGSGVAKQVADLELEAASYSRGFLNRVWYSDFGKPQLFADPAASYDIYSIVAVNPFKDKSGMDARIGEEIKLMIALNNLATGANTALDTIVAGL
jgi:hypothetical protein